MADAPGAPQDRPLERSEVISLVVENYIIQNMTRDIVSKQKAEAEGGQYQPGIGSLLMT